jgi:hypothetical protein
VSRRQPRDPPSGPPSSKIKIMPKNYSKRELRQADRAAALREKRAALKAEKAADDEASRPNSALETLVADDLPVAGLTMTPAQRMSLEQSPPDAATMAILVQRLTKDLCESNSAVDLDHAAILFGVPKDRIIEIVEVLDGIGLVKFTDVGEAGFVEWVGAKGMQEQIGTKERKGEDVDALREEIDKLYREESVLDAWIHRCQTLPHYTDRPFLYCTAGDIARVRQADEGGECIKDVTSLVIRAPPGGVLEVCDPEGQAHVGSKERRYQLSVNNKTGIATLPLPPPPVGDSSFDAAKFKESLKGVKIDMGETCGVGGISGNPVEIYHLSESCAPKNGDAMDIDGNEAIPSIKVRKIDIQTNLRGDVVGPAGGGVPTPEMLMNADVNYDADTLCLRQDEGASSFHCVEYVP